MEGRLDGGAGWMEGRPGAGGRAHNRLVK
jgi:hypothetical protein